MAGVASPSEFHHCLSVFSHKLVNIYGCVQSGFVMLKMDSEMMQTEVIALMYSRVF